MFNPPSPEVIIIGGSYAGLSAAMALGRARRRVLVLDARRPRNRFTPYAHNLLLHDGTAPADLAARARQQVAAYPTVALLEAEATAATKLPNGSFEVITTQGVFSSGKLLLASGLRDELPPVPGFVACWGKSIIHCPYCHGYEVADQATGLWLNGELVSHMVTMLRNWTPDLTVFTNGPATFGAEVRQQLAAQGVALNETPVAELLHEAGQLRALRLANGHCHPLPVLYAGLPWQQASTLPAQLGCELTERNLLRIDEQNQTTVPGVYAAGDCCSPLHQLAGAIAAGSWVGAVLSRQLIFNS
ncbi:NAD(P)/FAD-dependent oxidoreductase [Hymenobacter sp. HMF4947]|uniref:NAD(P)/FAD-dependent oxidoreductase n=1 Tax=Hymenobacter ginkgonis TaxID=2682976 RepID=A0A7K1TD70_9BACT|nr:NAD(P)/FAD-dependent oxidoreductase [Hymenobacter ginkgonis]MVN76131.1 NAD(P)/FAD-dependent oxidoreductase [Hymenobacter ginkgonis]